jgi:cytochrome c biogenesis protein CcdA
MDLISKIANRLLFSFCFLILTTIGFLPIYFGMLALWKLLLKATDYIRLPIDLWGMFFIFLGLIGMFYVLHRISDKKISFGKEFSLKKHIKQLVGAVLAGAMFGVFLFGIYIFT